MKDGLLLNQIIHGDSIEILKTFPRESIDVVFADPPYNLQLQNELWRPNQTKVDAVDDEWDKFDNFQEYDAFTRAWLEAVRPVMKSKSSIWVSGTYHNIFRVGKIMQDIGFWLLNTVVWMKCLSAGTRVYARTQIGDRPTTIKDLVRLDPSTVQLWNGEKWTQVIGWQKSNPRDHNEQPIRMRLRSGESIGCTPNHLWPTQRGLVRTDELLIGDILQSTQLPEPDAVDCPHLLPDDLIGWFVGLYIAEGSMGDDEKCIQISSHVRETERVEQLQKLAQMYHGTCQTYPTRKNGKGITINIYSPILQGVLAQYISGKTAHTKHLNPIVWQRSNAFLAAILKGYLSGDGHYDSQNQRWRLVFCNNDNWANDLRVLCGRLGLSLRLVRCQHTMNGRKFPGWRGNLRFEVSNHFNTKEDTEIIKIERDVSKNFWDIAVADEPHIFALASGVLSHNSNAMPNFNGTRLKNDVEFVIWAKKSEKSTYHFNYQLMKHFNDDKQLGSVWSIPICGGNERLLDDNGNKLHSTQKPEELLRRILFASGIPGAVVLDPFSGTGTTAKMAKELQMNWIGIERDEQYIKYSRRRIEGASQLTLDNLLFNEFTRKEPPKVEFNELVKNGYLEIGQTLYLDKPHYEAQILADGTLKYNGSQGSIHQLGKILKGSQSCNGWKHWCFKDNETGKLVSIDILRENYRLKQHGYHI